ncbi:TPA: tetratricopeptide repeat protein, partial [bacterium]|nr:tetratricopeptide repeat protein [bacterium]
MTLKIIAVLAGLFLIATFFMPGGSSVNVKNIYEEAEKAYAEKKYQEAIDKYNLAIAEGKKFGANTKVIDEDFDSLAKFKIATAYHELAKQLGDMTKYEDSLKLCPEIYDQTKTAKVKEGIIFLWGVNLYELERYEEAEPKFRELINDYPDSRFLENAHYTLGRLYYKLKQFESARESFKNVITGYPNSQYIDDSQYFIADCFFQEANYDQAHLEFEKVVSTDNDLLAQAKYYNGLSLLRMGRNQEALVAYQQYVGTFPGTPLMTAAYYDMGTIYAKLKEYDEATRNYELALQNAKDDITKGQIQFYIGGNYFEQEDYQMAISSYKKLMDNYPNDTNIPEARFYISESYWYMKDYQNALSSYSEALEKDPDGPHKIESMLKIGECHYQLGEKEVAIEWYDQIINNYPDSPLVKDATYSKLWALGDLKRYDEVEKVGRAYIEKYKNDPVYNVAAAETQMKLGDIRFEARDYAMAASEYMMVFSDYSDLPKFDPFKSRSLLQAGFSYYSDSENKNWDEGLLRKAAEAYEQMLNKYERNFDKNNREFEGRAEYVTSAIVNLGLTYSKLKETDKAVATFAMMPKSNPEYGRAVFLRGQAFIDAGRTDEAVALYRGMVTDKSLNEDWRSRAAIELASNLTKAGRHEEAIAEYQRIVTEYPKSEFVATAMYYIGSSYYELDPKTPENMNNAITAFKDVIAKYPSSDTTPWAYIGMMAAYDQLGDYNSIISAADEMETKYADSKISRVDEALDMARRRKVDAMQKMEEGMDTDTLIAELRKIVANPIGDEDGRAAAQMRISMLLFGDKRYGEAIQEFETLLEKFPGKFTGAAYYQIAASAYWMEDYAKAIEAGNKGLEVADLTQDIKTGLYYTLGLAYGKVNNDAEEITAMEKTVESASGATTDAIKQMDLSARRELARGYTDIKEFAKAEEQYLYLGENLPTPAEKADVYFWLARLYEEHIQNPQKAVEAYKIVIDLNASDILTAQSLYFSGVLFSNSIKDNEKALASFNELVSKYSSSEDASIKQMVLDANIRIPDILISMGKFDEALANARKARDLAETKEDKINAQYQVANLLGQRASGASGKTTPGAAREAANEFGKVVDMAKPLNQITDDNIKLIVAASLYNATLLMYNAGNEISNIDERFNHFSASANYAETFINNFPKNENYQGILQIIGYTTYEMARLKADLNLFDKAAQYFLRFAKEFPSHKDAPTAQFQAAEAYFTIAGGHAYNKERAKAAEAYRKTISAYRGVVDRYPNSEYAPDALYGIASCHAFIAEQLSDNRELDNMNKVYEELAQKYPKSKYAAVAFEAVGNSFYNQATAPNLTDAQKNDLFKKALDSYRKGLQVPGIEAKTKQSLEVYAKETEEILAQGPYSQALKLVPTAGTDPQTAKLNAPKAIQMFNQIISQYPNTDIADLSIVQIGLSYEAMEQWEEAANAYARLLKKYTDSRGNPIIPFSDNVVSAVEFAKGRRTQIL